MDNGSPQYTDDKWGCSETGFLQWTDEVKIEAEAMALECHSLTRLLPRANRRPAPNCGEDSWVVRRPAVS